MATGTTTVGFEEQLWQAADKLRSNMDAAEYKHVVLGLIFLKYVSDSFTEKYNALKAEGYSDEEDRDEYLADNIFWVPKEARWETIKAHATNPDIGEVIDAAMETIEKENDSLKGVLTKNYSRQELDKTRLGELVTLFTNIDVGTTAAQEKRRAGTCVCEAGGLNHHDGENTYRSWNCSSLRTYHAKDNAGIFHRDSRGKHRWSHG